MRRLLFALVSSCLLIFTRAQATSGDVFFTCDFTSDLCGFSLEGSVPWRRKRGGTTTSLTGPQGGYPFGQGFYMYREGSFTPVGTQSDLVWVISEDTEAFCLSFLYHMYGVDVGLMEVILTRGGSGEDVVWSGTRVGDFGENQWLRATVDISSDVTKVVFRATKLTSGPYADVALDYVTATSGSCSGLPVYVPPTSTTIATTTMESTTPLVIPQPGPAVYECTLEGAQACFMVQSQTDDGDWRIKSGRTPTALTGPTSGYGGSSRYLYLEASDMNAGDEVTIVSPALQPHAVLCLSFAYHVYGVHVGSLRVEQTDNDGSESVLWSSSESINAWQIVSLDLTPDIQQVSITAVRGGTGPRDIYGDIAIDAIRITDGNCSEPPTATVPTSPESTTNSINSTTSTNPSIPSSDQSSTSISPTDQTPTRAANTTTTTISTSSVAVSTTTSESGETNVAALEANSSDLAAGEIVAVVLCLCLLAVVVLVIFLVWRRRKSREPRAAEKRVLTSSSYSNPGTGSLRHVTFPDYYRQEAMTWREVPGTSYTTSDEFERNWAYVTTEKMNEGEPEMPPAPRIIEIGGDYSYGEETSNIKNELLNY